MAGTKRTKDKYPLPSFPNNGKKHKIAEMIADGILKFKTQPIKDIIPNVIGKNIESTYFFAYFMLL